MCRIFKWSSLISKREAGLLPYSAVWGVSIRCVRAFVFTTRRRLSAPALRMGRRSARLLPLQVFARAHGAINGDCGQVNLKTIHRKVPKSVESSHSRPFVPAMPLLNLFLHLFHPIGLMLLNGRQVVVAAAETAGVEGSPHVPKASPNMW
jgi:hypothetical protein